MKDSKNQGSSTVSAVTGELNSDVNSEFAPFSNSIYYKYNYTSTDS